MKKVLSIFLAVLMVFAIIPTTVFAASAPVITATADKTTVKVGDTVKVTVKLPANSNLVSLQYTIKYDSTCFQLVDKSMTLGNCFPFETSNVNVKGEVRYIAATKDAVNSSAATLFTVQFKVLKTGGKITFNIDEAYIVDSNGKDVDVTSACASASTKSITFKAATTTPTDYFTITEPSTKKISHKSGIVLHVNQKKTPPANAKYQWTANNNNFKMEVSADGKSCTIISNANGDTTFTVKLVSAAGTVLDTETVTMTSKAGFFDKIISFFRSLFGGNKVLPN
ncbi:MAG: hypothetical protein J6B37_07795 [Clostridia bacterium]|nr:hypothetical protein [Clostridia bacterium]